MREIRFRAWDADADRFTYSHIEDDLYVWGFEDGKLKAWAIVENPGSIDEPPYPDSVELEPPQQFVDLKDKTDKEIYEGDVCRAVYPDIPQNEYTDLDQTFVVEWEGNIPGPGYIGYNFGNYETIEIIGDIYENPDLVAATD